MRRIDKFAFAHRTPGQDLDATSTALLVDGKPAGIAIEGLKLVDQFDTGRGYLLVTDYNDPWEEQTVVTLLDAEFEQLDKKRLGKFFGVFPSRTFSVRTIDIDGEPLLFQGSGPEEGCYLVGVADVPRLLGPRVGLKASWHQG